MMCLFFVLFFFVLGLDARRYLTRVLAFLYLLFSVIWGNYYNKKILWYSSSICFYLVVVYFVWRFPAIIALHIFPYIFFLISGFYVSFCGPYRNGYYSYFHCINATCCCRSFSSLFFFTVYPLRLVNIVKGVVFLRIMPGLDIYVNAAKWKVLNVYYFQIENALFLILYSLKVAILRLQLTHTLECFY